MGIRLDVAHGHCRVPNIARPVALAAGYELLTARSSECVGMTRRVKRISIDERRAAGRYRKVAMRSYQGPRIVTTDDTSRVE